MLISTKIIWSYPILFERMCSGYVKIMKFILINLKAAGMFNSSLIHGMEDWDLWLRIADMGYWGYTMPEFMFWYYRKGGGRWKAMEDPNLLQQFKVKV